MKYYIDKVKYTHVSFALVADGVSILRKASDIDGQKNMHMKRHTPQRG